MVSLKLSTLQPVVAAGDPSPPLFAHPRPPAPCILRFSRRRPTKSLALSSTRNVRRSAGAAPLSGEEKGGETSAPERFLGSTKIADFMRLNWVPKESRGQLQTAVVGYTRRFPWSLVMPSLRVDLVSTIHIADKEYFTTLQEELQQYDCVLYEMVTSRESLESGSGPTAARRLKRSSSKAMKVDLAKQVTSEFPLDTTDVINESVIVGQRNRAAIEALKSAIDDGHDKIAILYGAGHMPDLGRRLQEELDLVPFRVQWITAWSIGNRGSKTDSFPWQLLLVLFVVVVADLCLWGLFIGTMVHWLSQIASEVDRYVGGTLTTIPW